MDERLAAYVGTQWDELVDHARDRCASSDATGDALAQDLVLSTLTTCAVRWRMVRDHDQPDNYVRRQLARACKARDRRQVPQEKFQMMQVGVVNDAPAGTSDDTSTPPATSRSARITASEAVAIVDQRTRRVHRSLQVMGAVAVVAVAAIWASDLSGSGSSKPQVAAAGHVRSVSLVAFPELPTHFASDVTTGLGAIWTIESRGAATDAQAVIVERDPVSGQVVARYAAPKTDDRIAFGFRKIWVWHDSANYPSKTTIATVDTVGDVTSFRTRPATAITSATFTNRAAWFVEPATQTLIRFPGGVLVDPQRTRSRRARFIVPLSKRSVLIAEADGTLRELPGDREIAPSTTPPTLLSPAPAYGIWTGHGDRVSFQRSVNAKPSVTITLPLRVAAVVGTPTHGVFVATTSNNPLHYDPYLAYYAPTALDHANPQPTAQLNGLVQAEHLVASPAGGIVFVTNKGTVYAWNPAVRSGR
jgi:hypothetical protein